jgi:hypothetical protein
MQSFPNLQYFKVIVLQLSGFLLAAWLGFAIPACKVNRLVSDIETAIDLREAMESAGSAKIAWRIARRVNTFESYRNFLVLYPNSSKAADALERLKPYGEAVWEEVRWAMDQRQRVQDYLLVKYLDLFPEGSHSDEIETAYGGMPDSTLWYTLGFRDLSLAPFIFDRLGADSFNLHRLRLEGLCDYLMRFPDGLLSNIMSERLARTYIGYRLLPADSTVTPYLFQVNDSLASQYEKGLKDFAGMPEAASVRTAAYLRYVLEYPAELPVGDQDNNSIIDDLEMPEVQRFPRRALSDEEEEALRGEQRRLEQLREEVLSRRRLLREELAEFKEEFEIRRERVPIQPGVHPGEELDRIGAAVDSLQWALANDLPLESFEDLKATRAFLERSKREMEQNMSAARAIFKEVSEAAAVRDKDEEVEVVPETTTSVEEGPETSATGPSRRDEIQDSEALLDDLAEKNLQSITSGKFLYDSIPVLTVGIPYLFKLAITPDTGVSIAPDLINPEEAISRSIPISNEMSVRIIADRSAFNIQPVSDTIQLIDFKRGTLWSWQIIPLKPGRHRVTVNIDILTKSLLTGEVRRQSVNVYQEEVDVIVEDQEEETTPAPFGIDPLYWLLLLIPAGLLFFLWRRKKKASLETASGAFPGETPQEQQFLRDHQEEMFALMEKAESWIAKGDTQRALNELLDFFNNRHEPIHKELVTLSARFSKYQREANLGLDPNESVLNRTNLALIELMGRVRGGKAIRQ